MSMTYEDAILADATDVNVLRRNARTSQTTIYKDIVEIDKSRNDRNVSGGFTVCVTETTPIQLSVPTKSPERTKIVDGFEDVIVLGRLSRRARERDGIPGGASRDVEKLKEEEDKEERLLQGTLTSIRNRRNRSSKDA